MKSKEQGFVTVAQKVWSSVTRHRESMRMGSKVSGY